MEGKPRKARKGPIIHMPYPKREDYLYEDIDKEYRKPLLVGFVRNLGGDSDMYAEDFTQEVLFRAWRTLDKIDSEYIHVYLSRLAANLLIDHSRSKQFGMDMRRHDPALMESDDNEGGSQEFVDTIMYDEAYDYLDPETVVHHNERYAYLQRRIDQFPPIDRFIINEHFDRGVALKQVAEWLDITYANSRKRVQRIRERLRDYYEEEKKEFMECQH